MKFKLCEDFEHWSDSEIDKYFKYDVRIDDLLDNEYFGSETSDEMKNLLFKLIDFADDNTIHSYCRDYEFGYPEEHDDEDDEDDYYEDEIAPFDSGEDLKEYLNDIDDFDYRELVDNLLRYISYDELRDFYYYSGMNAFDETNFDDQFEDEIIDDETYQKIKKRFADDKNWSLKNLNSKSDKKNQTTRVSFEDVEKSATNFAEEVYGFSEEDAERGFILRDGFIVSNNSLLNNFKNDRHGNADAKIVDAVLHDLHITLKDLQSAVHMNFSLDANGANGSLLADCLGWIRVNGGSEQYVSLPEKAITNDQKYALADWLENYMDGHKQIKITTYNGQQVTYVFNGDEARNIEPYTGEDIANKVMKYYQSGKLEENKKQ